MSGARSHRKGATFERLVDKLLAPVFPGALRGVGQARYSNEDADVTNTPFWVEAKHQKRVSIQAAVKQARKETDGRPILVVTRRDREPILVTMELTVWLSLIQDNGIPRTSQPITTTS